MKTQSTFVHLLFSLVILIYFSCDQPKKDTDNTLLNPWIGSFEGIPAFDQVRVEDVEEAMLSAMASHLEEIQTIADDTAPPTFENTIVAMERSGYQLERAYAYYGVLSRNQSTPKFRDIQKKLAPDFADYRSKIIQNEKLFKKIATVYEFSKQNPLEADQQRLLEWTYQTYEMSGAALDKKKKNRYAEINKELSQLYTSFSNNVLHDEENYITYLTKDQLGGLPEGFIKSSAQIANDKGEEGKYAIINTRSSMDPFLTFSTERLLRKQVWENYYSRGDNEDEYDNKAIIAEILKLRNERVQLLGYANFAEWRLQNRMAKTPKNALDLLETIWPSATERVAEEVADMQMIANQDQIVIAPWDYRFYAEKVRKEKYDLDSDEVKQYLQLDQLTDAMHYVAGRLFFYDFSPLAVGTVPVFNEDVKVWEVKDKRTGKHIGLWYLDPFARPGKRSGAWATTYRSYSSFDGEKNVLASNNSNFVKPAPGEPVLVSWDDATTFFHEFGHALHFFASNVRYPTLNSGVRDYTEFQSQLLERWLSSDEVIDKFLIHHQTGEPIPDDLVAKIKNAATFNQGFATTEYLASALMDLKLHMSDPDDIDMESFERETLKSMNMPKELPMRHRTPHFSHVFSGEGYATAYYGYIWADVLTADAAEAFVEAPGGFYDDKLAKRLVKYLFAPRNSIDPQQAYRWFRGRDAQIDALMRARGFAEHNK
jgi:peptidyl-dipeptidase Dcp